MLDFEPEKKIFLYIGKGIFSKFWILELSDKIFTNKVEFSKPSKFNFISKNFVRQLQNSKFAKNPFTNI